MKRHSSSLSDDDQDDTQASANRASIVNRNSDRSKKNTSPARMQRAEHKSQMIRTEKRMTEESREHEQEEKAEIAATADDTQHHQDSDHVQESSISISNSELQKPEEVKQHEIDAPSSSALANSLASSASASASASSSSSSSSCVCAPPSSRSSSLRLQADLRLMDTDPPAGISASPVDSSNLYLWRACIFGPDDSEWEGGVFQLQLTFDHTYPLKAPHVRFLSSMFHPNIFADGALCLDIIQDKWSPIFTVSSLLTSIQSLLSDPNTSSPANSEASELFKKDKKEYRRRVRLCVQKSTG